MERLRIEALLNGERYYRDGKACRNGHDSPRYVSAGRCVQCNRRKRLRWAARHPEDADANLRRHLVRLGNRRVGPMV